MSNLNSFLDNALETAKVVANAAGKKTEEVVEASKLRFQSIGISNELKQAYEKIGTMVYYAQKDHMDVQAALEAQIAKVDQLLEQLHDAESRMAELKKVKKCSNCGASCPADSHFCSRCGMVINESTAPAEPGAFVVEVELEGAADSGEEAAPTGPEEFDEAVKPERGADADEPAASTEEGLGEAAKAADFEGNSCQG